MGKNSKCSIYKNIWDTEGMVISVSSALDRIKHKQQERVLKIRSMDKEARQEEKKQLPVVCFGGVFSKRGKNFLSQSSGYMPIDVDGVSHSVRKEIEKDPYVAAVWDSPSCSNEYGAFKYLVKIPHVSSDKEYKEHYNAWILHSKWDVDDSGADISRGCYESWDENILIKEDAKTFALRQEPMNGIKKYARLERWADTSDSYAEGNRNNFLFKLASACNRMGVDSTTVEQQFGKYDLPSNEKSSIIKSAYSDVSSFGQDSFQEIKSQPPKPKTIERIVAPEGINSTLREFYSGNADHLKGTPTGVSFLDDLLLFKTNEFYQVVSHLGIGKTTVSLYLMLMAAVNADWKIILATAENSPEETKNMLVAFLLRSRINERNYATHKADVDVAMKLIDDHFIIADTAGSTIYDILSMARELRDMGKGADAVFIDPINSFKTSGRKSAYDAHVEQAADLLSFSVSVCSVFLTTHTISGKQRDGEVPQSGDAEFGTVYANKAHVVLAYQRNPHAVGVRQHETDVYIHKQRSRLMRGGGVTDKEHPVKFIFNPSAFGFTIEYEDSLEQRFTENNPIKL